VVLGVLFVGGCAGAVSPQPSSTGSPAVSGTLKEPPPGSSGPVTTVALQPCPASFRAPVGGGKDRLPAVRLRCMGPGPAVDLQAGHGRVTVVNLWASWCGPCRVEMPRLRASAARLGGAAGFLGVDVKDDPTKAWAFLGEVKVRYANVSDPEDRMLAGLGIHGVPLTFAVDTTGAIVYRHVGQMHASDITGMEQAVRSAG
jgi:cytochrome c biogenesis protein CcmG, thiol:disulfide interchange protein DsbE